MGDVDIAEVVFYPSARGLATFQTFTIQEAFSLSAQAEALGFEVEFSRDDRMAPDGICLILADGGEPDGTPLENLSKVAAFRAKVPDGKVQWYSASF